MTGLYALNETEATLHSFDRTESVVVCLRRPDRYRHLFTDLSAPAVISRGAGLTYCLASGSQDGISVSSAQFNRFLAFNEQDGTVLVEPGVDMGRLLAFATSRNLLPPVLPGYPRVTVGGAVAMNIHGKNQFQVGSFGDHIRSLTLFHPDKGELRCSPGENADIFRLTIGGFGLTGHITSVEIALKRSPGNKIAVRRHAVKNLFESVALMEQMVESSEYLYSWHDFNLGGSDFGRGIIYSESHCEAHMRPHADEKTRLGPPLPWTAFNRFTIPLVSKMYQIKEKLAPRVHKLHLDQAFFPFAGKELYFRLFGPRGFREYQALFPRSGWDESSRQIAKAISEAGAAISFGSLKLMRGERKLLNFVGEGVGLALDAPNLPATDFLFSLLDEIVIHSGGLANIGKDGRLTAATVRRMYGCCYDKFRDEIRQFDSSRRFMSELRRRIEV